MPTLSRRERASAAKQERIVAAAASLFQAHGYAATTTEQIAAQADIAKGTLFLYAPTKLHLLVMAYEADLAALVGQAFASPPGSQVVAALLEIFSRFFSLYERNRELARLYVQAQLFPPEPAPSASALEALFAHLVSRIQAWQAAGHVRREIDPALAAQTTFALYLVVVIGWLSGRLTSGERDAQLRASFGLHWQGLISPPASAAADQPGGAQ